MSAQRLVCFPKSKNCSSFIKVKENCFCSLSLLRCCELASYFPIYSWPEFWQLEVLYMQNPHLLICFYFSFSTQNSSWQKNFYYYAHTNLLVPGCRWKVTYKNDFSIFWWASYPISLQDLRCLCGAKKLCNCWGVFNLRKVHPPIFTKHENTLHQYLSVLKCLLTTCSSTFLTSGEILDVNSINEAVVKRIPVLPIITCMTHLQVWGFEFLSLIQQICCCHFLLAQLQLEVHLLNATLDLFLKKKYIKSVQITLAEDVSLLW